MKLRSMEEKISYRLFLMGFLGLLFTAALCIFVFHKAFTAQAWTSLEREADLATPIAFRSDFCVTSRMSVPSMEKLPSLTS